MMKIPAAALRTPLLAAVLACAIGSPANAQVLPSPWATAHIGSPAVSGSATFGSGVFTIDGVGIDIAGTSDQFSFIYQPIAGNVDVIARVESLSAVNGMANAGLMIRSSLTAASAHGYAGGTASRGLRFRARTTAGATTSETSNTKRLIPAWLRIVRLGSTITGYSSTDGVTWSALGTSKLPAEGTVYVGLAVASQDSSVSAAARVSNVVVKKLELPAGQQSMDIGAPALEGHAYAESGAYTVVGAGAGIAGTADQFHFAYQPVRGNLEVIARVSTVTFTNPWSAAGVMIRESLTAESRHATAVLTPKKAYQFHRRLEPGGGTLQTGSGSGTAPGWVRLVRTGDRFEAYRSTDGSAWTSIGAENIAMGETVYVGLAATSASAGSLNSATIDNARIIAAVEPVNQSPAVSVISPTTGAVVTLPAQVTIEALASDPENRLLSVDFYVGSTLIARDTAAPYSTLWTVPAAGTYSFAAIAHDADGGSTTSSVVSVTAQAPSPVNQPPSVSLTTGGASFTAPANITLSAAASDPEGQLARVEFFSGTTRLAADTAAPYTFDWTGVAAGTYSLTAVAYDTAGASATSAPQTVTVSAAQSVPSPWTAADIGSPALSGSAALSNGSFSVQAGGWDIWGYSDEFHFIYQAVTGDVEIVARVDTLANVHEFAKAGVMIRAALTGDSINAFAQATGSRGVYLTSRSSTGGMSTAVQGPYVSAPVWVRVMRRGTTITSHTSVDGNTWTLLGSQTLALGTTAYVGLAVTSHDVTQRTSASFSNVHVGPPNQNPTVSITTPAAGTSVTLPAQLTIAANASDPENRMLAVDFYAGSTLVARDTTAPYSVLWSVPAAGTHALTAVAHDADGGSTTSSVVTVTAQAANQPPSVSLSTGGTSFTAPASITLNAAASDPEGQLARVEFMAGTTLLATDTTAPYSFTWSSVPAGTYSVTAIAYDAGGLKTTSAPVLITVGAAVLSPPRLVVFGASSDHATNVTSYALKVFSAGANTATAIPVATSDLGKPTPAANGEITVDRQTFFGNLAAGNYVATVTAIGPGGQTPSAGVSFTR